MTVSKRTWRTASGEDRSCWQASVTDAAGKRVRKSFATKREAIAWRDATACKARSGAYRAAAEHVTFAEAVDQYLDHLRARRDAGEVEPRYLASVQALARHVLAPETGLARAKLASMRRADVEDARDRLLTRISRPLTRKAVALISRALDRAVARDLLSANVARGVTVATLRGSEAPIEIPARKTITTLIEAAPDDFKVPLMVAVSTGLRAGELWGLTWRCVDLNGRTLRVEQRVDQSGQVGPPKSAAGYRTVPLSRDLATQLKAAKLASPFKADDEFVFPARAGTAVLHGNVLQRRWYPLLEATGIRLRWHDLRHYAISSWIAAGLEAKTVATYAGHSSIVITFDRYGHLMREADHREAMDKIAADLHK